MLKWAVAPEERRRRDPNSYKRRKLSFLNGRLEERSSSTPSPASRSILKGNNEGSSTHAKVAPGESEGESKSQFYMSLDHLPMAIVKQYEKMIQETENTQNNSPDRWKPKSKSSDESEMVFKEEPELSRIREAIHRPLKQGNHIGAGILRSTQRYSDTESSSSSSMKYSPVQSRVDGNTGNHEAFALPKFQKSILKRNPTSGSKTKLMNHKDEHKFQRIRTAIPEKRLNHDTTDPEFLNGCSPVASRGKFSLKRRELRKLEKLRSESEKLNRFLRKYYNDCLPKLPPEEEAECSPEDKSLSVFLGQLAKSIVLWDKGLELSDSTSTSTDSDAPFAWPESNLPAISEDTEVSSDAAGSGKRSPIQVQIRTNPRDSPSTGRAPPWSEDAVMNSEVPFDPPPPLDQGPNDALHTPATSNYSEDEGPLRLESTPRKMTKCRQTVLGRRKTPTSSATTKGEVHVRSYRNGTYVTLHVLAARNLQHLQNFTPVSKSTPSKSKRPSWKLSFKVSLVDEADEIDEKVQASSWVKVNRGQRRVEIDQKFSFDSGGVIGRESEGKVKAFISFWRQSEKGKSSLIGWTRTHLVEEQESWLLLKRDKMRRSRHPIQLPLQKLSNTATEIDIEERVLGSTSILDSGVEDCGSEQCNNGSQHGFPARIAVSVKKEYGENGFGFTVIWSSPPRIGRITEGTAADRAGLKKGDLISRVNDEDIGHLQREAVIQKMKAFGEHLELEIFRDLELEPQCFPCDPSTSNDAQTNYFPNSIESHSHCSLSMMYFPPPISILKPPPPPLPVREDFELRRRSAGAFWKIQFKAGVGQGTIV